MSTLNMNRVNGLDGALFPPLQSGHNLATRICKACYRFSNQLVSNIQAKRRVHNSIVELQSYPDYLLKDIGIENREDIKDFIVALEK